MTREEAIGHIKDVICENNTIKPNIVVFEQEKEALYMAIKALEQETVSKESYEHEYFLRKEFEIKIAKLEQEPKYCDRNICLKNEYNGISCDECEVTKSQEPKTGHWIAHREHCENLGVLPSGLGAYEWCSECDCGIDVREWHRNNYNYCPNCGAKMENEEC